MKNNKVIIIVCALFASMFSCENYLDELPDNRTELDSETKIRKLLVSAYPSKSHAMITELSSDNVDDQGESNPYSERLYEQIAYWKNITEEDSDGAAEFWSDTYLAIAHANQALQAIEELGSPNSLSAEKGEALITRAYGHFLLVNVFCKHYTTTTSATDLGIPYMTAPETKLDPKYERGSVEGVYKLINDDIEAALPLIDDNIYDVASYHFNTRASYAFAARFNLYYEKWDKALDYANSALGNNPESVLRQWSRLGSLPKSPGPVVNAYIDDSSNLLVQAHASNLGVVFGAFYSGARFTHTRKKAIQETLQAPMPFRTAGVPRDLFEFAFFMYEASNLDKTLLYKIPYRFEYTDPVARIGYARTVLVPFNTDETLLVRAEAKSMLNKFDEALADINTWVNNFYKGDNSVTIKQVNDFYDSIETSTSTGMNSKKELNPKFNLAEGTQKNLIHYVLQCRRVLTLHEGLRWFDVKRYGIPVPRLLTKSNGVFEEADLLTSDDKRRAIQIPQSVVDAGLKKNPR